MPIFTSDAELRKYILEQSKKAVEETKEIAYDVIEEFLQQFYDDYDPKSYHRTKNLFNSLVKTEVRSTGDGWEAEVYFDASKMKDYATGRWSTEQVLSAALHGSHGGYDRTAPIEGQSLNWLNAHAIPILKDQLIAAGIPVV